MVQILQLLNLKFPLVLASKSPRRISLLNQLGLDFIIKPADLDEKNHNSIELHPAEYAKNLALAKATAIADSLDYPAIVIGADTIVVLDGEILNKPEDEEDAKRMLRTLSGRTHKVYTGIALAESENGRYFYDVEETFVTFRKLDEEEIDAYVASGSPMDKAGAYGIQDDFGAVFVEHINGCYYNIVGLPLVKLYTSLKSFAKSLKEEKKADNDEKI